MNREQVRSRIEQIGIIPAIRVASADDALFAVEAIAASGVPVAEVTLTIPGAVDVIRRLASNNSELIIGAGTVLDTEMARECLDAGARFLSSPDLNLEVVAFAHKRDVAVLPGAMTPTEIAAAWRAGSDFVKVFPCAALGGASYIHSLKAPFPKIPLMASGGVTEQTAADFIHAGATMLGIGRDLVSPEAIRRRQPQWFQELARRFLGIVQSARHPQAD